MRQAYAPEEKRIDYRNYRFTLSELILNVLIGLMLAWAIGHFFYDSLIVSAGLLVFIPAFLRYRRIDYGTRRRNELGMQFKDAVASISANQKAGYSIENSFREAWKDMTLLYGTRGIIVKELNHIRRGLDNNLVLEQMLLELGARSGVDDIRQFGEVFAIAKRSGGNLTETIEMTAGMIEQKADVEQEIAVMISSRKMESNVMSLVPFFMILYMDLSSAGFFDELYHNVAGIAIMTVCLAIYVSSYLIAQKMVDIRI
ncbi:MAG: type II secretion system F family protein [Lachnospiraceae bacterium]|nr:type II secretion system F family protein [Lachnospiraceae bacterium]